MIPVVWGGVTIDSCQSIIVKPFCLLVYYAYSPIRPIFCCKITNKCENKNKNQIFCHIFLFLKTNSSNLKMKMKIIITFSLGFFFGGGVALGWAFSYMMLYTPSNFFKGLCFKETQHSNSVKMGLVLCGYLVPWYTHKTISKCLSGIFVSKNNLLFIIKVLGIFPLKKNDASTLQSD